MANLEQNTSYQTSSPTKAVPKLNLSGLNAKRIANVRKFLPSSAKSASSLPFVGTYNLATAFSPVSNEYENFANTVPQGQIISPVTENTSETVSAYNANRIAQGLAPLVAKTSGLGADKTTNNLPSFNEKTKLVSVTSSNGMDSGQFFIDPDGGDNQLVTGEYEYDERAKAMLLGKLSPNLYEVEHVVPRWAGGADTMGNKTIMSKVDHNKKTKIQAIPYTLFMYSYLAKQDPNTLSDVQKNDLAKLTPEQLSYFKTNAMPRSLARTEAMDWKSRSDVGISTFNDSTGTVDPDEAIKTYKQWYSAPKVTIKSVLAEVPKAIGQAFGAKLRKNIDQGFSDVGKMIPAIKPLAQFTKGAMLGVSNALSFGKLRQYAPDLYTEQETLEPKTTWDKVSDAAGSFGGLSGEIAGSMIAFGKMTQVIGGIGKTASALTGIGAKGLPFAERAKTIPLIGGLLSRIGTEAKVGGGFLSASKVKSVKTATEELAKELNIARKTIGPVTEASIPKIAATVTKEGKVAVQIGELEKRLTTENVGKVAKSIGLQIAFGQLMENTDATMADRMKRVWVDTAYGTFLGSQAQTLRGYSQVFGAATVIAALDTGDVGEAFKQGLIITGLHGIGLPASQAQKATGKAISTKFAKRFTELKPGEDLTPSEKIEITNNAGLLTPAVREQLIEHIATRSSKSHLDPFNVFHNPGETPRDGSVTIAEYLDMTPKEQYDIKYRARRKLQNWIDNREAVGQDGKIIKDQTWDLEDVLAEEMRLNTAFTQIERGALSVEVRNKIDRKNMKAYMDEIQRRSKKDDSAPATLIEQKILQNTKYIEDGDGKVSIDLNNDLSPEIVTMIGADAPIGKAAVTGITAEISLARDANIRELEAAKSEKTNSGLDRLGKKWIGILRPELEPVVRRSDSYKSPDARDPNPQNIMDVYATIRNKETDAWEFRHVGMIASNKRLNEGNNRINSDKNIGGDQTRIIKNDKDTYAKWGNDHDTRVLYLNPDEFYSGAVARSGKPWVKVSTSGDDLFHSIEDFGGTRHMRPVERDPETLVGQAFKVKTPQEAKIVADNIKKSVPIESYTKLNKKAKLDKTEDPIDDLKNLFIEDMRSHQKELIQGKTTEEVLDAIRNRSGLGRLVVDMAEQSSTNVTRPDSVRKTVFQMPNEGTVAEIRTPESVVAEVNEVLKPAYGKDVIQKGTTGIERSKAHAEAIGSIVKKVSKPVGAVEAPQTPKTPADVTIAIEKPLKAAKQAFDSQVQQAKVEVAKQESHVLDQTPEQQSAALNRAVPADEVNDVQPKEIRSEAWSEWSEGLNKGLVQDVAQRIKGKEVTPEGKAMLEFVKSSKKENTLAVIREIKSKNLDENGYIKPQQAFSEFESRFGNKLDSLGLTNPFKDPRSRQVLEHYFQDQTQKIKRNVLTISDQGYGEKWRSNTKLETEEHIASKLDELMGIPNSERGDILYVRNGMKNPEVKNDTGRAFTEINDILNKRGYVILGSTGNTMDDLIALKRSKAPTWKEFQKNEKYSAGELDQKVDPETGKTFAEELASSEDARLIRSFVVDTLGLSATTKKDQIMKRWKEINSHEIVNNHRNEDGSIPDYEMLVRTSPTISEAIDKGGNPIITKATEGNGFLSWLKQKMFFQDKGAYDASIQATLKKAMFDGVQYVNKTTKNTILKANAMGEQGRIKPTFVSKMPDGTITQKGNMTELSPEMEKFMIERGILKEPLKDNQILTFHDNVKIGDRGQDFEYTMPATDMRLEWHGEHSPTGGFSLSNLGKLSADSLHPQLHEMYKGEIDRWQKFNKDLRKPGADLKALKKEYADYLEGYDDDWVALQNMIKNGASSDGVDLQKSLQTLSNKIFSDHILSGRFIKGDHLYVKPDTKMTVWDPNTREKPTSRFLNSGEVALTKKQWEDMGKPKDVMVIRFPTTRDTAMIKAKVLLTDSKNLGREEAVLNYYDGYVRLEYDFDGDSIKVLPIGKDGVPESIADSIETIRGEKGDMLLPALKKYDDAPITANSLRNGAFASIQGGTEVGKTASLMRVMEDVVGSKLSASLSKSKNGKSLFEIWSNGKMIHQEEVKSDNEKRIEVSPTWGDEEKFLSAQIMQEAVDSMKYQNLFNRLMESKTDSTGVILQKVLNTEDKTMIASFKKFLNKFQEPYSTVKKGINNIGEFENDFSEYNDLKKKIEEAGGKVGHAGRIFTSIKEDSFIPDTKQFEVYPSDRKGIEAVKKYAEENGIDQRYKKIIASDKTVQDFVKLVSQTRYDAYMNNRKNLLMKTSTGERGDFPELKDLRKNVIQTYNNLYSELSSDQIGAINYWLLGSGKSPANDPANARIGIISFNGKSELSKAIKEFISFAKTDLDLNLTTEEASKYIQDYGAYRNKNDSGDVWRYSEIFDKNPNEMSQAYYGAKKGIIKTPEAIRKEDTIIDRDVAKIKAKDATTAKLKEVLKGLQKDRVQLVVEKADNEKVSDVSNSINSILDRLKAKSR